MTLKTQKPPWGRRLREHAVTRRDLDRRCVPAIPKSSDGAGQCLCHGPIVGMAAVVRQGGIQAGCHVQRASSVLSVAVIRVVVQTSVDVQRS